MFLFLLYFFSPCRLLLSFLHWQPHLVFSTSFFPLSPLSTARAAGGGGWAMRGQLERGTAVQGAGEWFHAGARAAGGALGGR
jgi:hypothetical protein